MIIYKNVGNNFWTVPWWRQVTEGQHCLRNISNNTNLGNADAQSDAQRDAQSDAQRDAEEKKVFRREVVAVVVYLCRTYAHHVGDAQVKDATYYDVYI